MIDPQKRAFLSFVIKTEKKLFFFIFFFCFRNNRRTNVILISIFENSQNNRYYIKWRFWWSITFVLRFKKLPIKRTFVRPLFLKLNQSRNVKTIFLGGFSSKTKNALFWGSKMVLFKSQISNLYFCVCSLM